VIARATKTEEVARAVKCDLALSRDKALTAITHLWTSRRPEFYGEVVGRVRRRM
jgi:hypothetical protein